jgi:tetratricopeptide (TPR) repeat protein
MVKCKMKITILSVLIISSLLVGGCSSSKYNTKGNFNLKQSQKLCEEDKYDEELKNIDEFLKKYPNNKEANSQKGYVLIAKGENEEGLLILTDLVENDAASSSVLNNISWAYNNLHMYQLANKYIDIGLKSSSATDKDYINKGNALFGLKKFDEALSWYDKALDKNSHSSFAVWGKGLCLYAKKEYAQCLVFFRQYRELDVEDKSANNYIASAYLEQKDFAGGIEEFNNLIKKSPNDDSLYLLVGDIYQGQGDFIKAIDGYDSVIKRSPDNADAYYEKSVCLAKLDKKDEACENLKLAIEYDKEYVYDAKEQPEFYSLRDYDKFKAIINGN